MTFQPTDQGRSKNESHTQPSLVHKSTGLINLSLCWMSKEMFNQFTTTTISEATHFEPPPLSPPRPAWSYWFPVVHVNKMSLQRRQSWKCYIMSLPPLPPPRQAWSYWFPRPGPSQLVGPVCTESYWVQGRPSHPVWLFSTVTFQNDRCLGRCIVTKGPCQPLWPFQTSMEVSLTISDPCWVSNHFWHLKKWSSSWWFFLQFYHFLTIVVGN